MTEKRGRVVLDDAAVTALTTAMDNVSAFLEGQRWRKDNAARVEALNEQLGLWSYRLKKRLGDAKGD